jgi:hypothetical protein
VVLSGSKECLQHTNFLDKLLPAARERNKLFSFPARTEVLSNFFESTAEALGRGNRTKAEHRVIALFDAAMILFDPAVQISVLARNCQDSGLQNNFDGKCTGIRSDSCAKFPVKTTFSNEWPAELVSFWEAVPPVLTLSVTSPKKAIAGIYAPRPYRCLPLCSLTKRINASGWTRTSTNVASSRAREVINSCSFFPDCRS